MNKLIEKYQTQLNDAEKSFEEAKEQDPQDFISLAFFEGIINVLRDVIYDLNKTVGCDKQC